MGVEIKNINQFLANKPNAKNGIGSLVLEYAKLNQQLNDIEHQSIYFQSGIESNRKRLNDLKASYESTQQYFNKNSLDVFIVLKNEKEEKLNSIDWSKASMITRILKGGLISDIAYLKESIAIKKVFTTLPNLYDLINNLKNLIALINVS